MKLAASDGSLASRLRDAAPWMNGIESEGLVRYMPTCAERHWAQAYGRLTAAGHNHHAVDRTLDRTPVIDQEAIANEIVFAFKATIESLAARHGASLAERVGP